MSQTCHIHIGMHKTGTTSIQNTLFRNLKILRRENIGYLSLCANHSEPMVAAFGNSPERYYNVARYALRPKGNLHEYSRNIRAYIENEFSQNTSRDFIVSGEDLSSWHFPIEEVNRLHSLLRQYFEAAKCVVYVRHPFEYVCSAAQQIIRRGEPLERLTTNLPKPKYQERMEKYVQIFGIDNVTIRLFDRSIFVNGDVIHDFLDIIVGNVKAKRLMKKIKIINSNASLSDAAVKILDAINVKYPVRGGAEFSKRRAPNVAAYLKKVEGNKFRFDQNTLLEYRNKIQEDVNWLGDLTHGRILFSINEKDCAIYGIKEEIFSKIDNNTEELADFINDVAWKIENGQLLSLLYKDVIRGVKLMM